ncbi:perlucin-like protein isoform X2 [Mytilus galloprovincialis]|uniref:perlucin-like protein isoform X2 n=1 Tax=Mytilus galloprovincialis TaxID=29158 RepID=UPI003F7B87EE
MHAMYLLTIILVIASANADICLTESKWSQMRTKLGDIEQLLQNPAIPCKSGWKQFNSHCYYFSDDKKTWFEAERYCRTQNAFLADVRDVTENNWIQSNLKGTDIYWIGATNFDAGEWIWSYDYSLLTYSNWNTGEPNNRRHAKGQGENCCHMYVTGKWNDTLCRRKAKFVCKRHANNHFDQR